MPSKNDEYEPPERNYNIVSCLIISLIGSIFGGLAVSGLIFPVWVYLLNLLPHENLGIPQEISSMVCGGMFWFLVLIAPAIWIIQKLGHIARRKQTRKKREDFDSYFAGLRKNQPD
jgi:CBS domain containing-hemolysin-like protein